MARRIRKPVTRATLKVADARRRARRIAIVAYHGNRCAFCKKTYPTECYDLHHKDVRMRTINFSSGMSRSLKSLIEATKHCVLLCANCHRMADHADGTRNGRRHPEVMRRSAEVKMAMNLRGET